MLQDQINFGPSLKSLRVRCYDCKKTDHIINQCNLMHFCQDRERLIKHDDFSHFQERNSSFIRKKSIKKRFKLLKEIKMAMKSPLDPNNEGDYSSDEDPDEETKEKMMTKQASSKSDIFFPQSSIVGTERKTSGMVQMLLFDKTRTKQFLDENSKERKSCFKQAADASPPTNNEQRKSCLLDPKPRISVLRESDVSQNNKQNPGIPRSSRKSFHQNVSISFDPQFSRAETTVDKGTEGLKSSVALDNDNTTTCNIETLGFEFIFEKIGIFRKYFPKNSFTLIQKRYNERNPGVRLNKKKMNELKKCSQFTFFAEKLYDMIKKKSVIRKSTRKNNTRITLEKDGAKQEIQKIDKMDNFVKLVSQIMKTQKEKNKKGKWYAPIVRIIKKFMKRA